RSKWPLEVSPFPVTTDMRPPLLNDDVPARRRTSPPEPLLPEPTVTYTEPPRPDFAAPVPTIKAPLLPEEEVPELNTKSPLTPDAPASDVCNSSDPLVVVEL